MDRGRLYGHGRSKAQQRRWGLRLRRLLRSVSPVSLSLLLSPAYSRDSPLSSPTGPNLDFFALRFGWTSTGGGLEVKRRNNRSGGYGLCLAQFSFVYYEELYKCLNLSYESRERDQRVDRGKNDDRVTARSWLQVKRKFTRFRLPFVKGRRRSG